VGFFWIIEIAGTRIGDFHTVSLVVGIV